MAAHDNIHSRLVAWLKVILPLAALALLSTMFLVSRGIAPEDALPYSEVDVEELAREPRLTAPRYSGVTLDGAALSVTAEVARPDVGGAGQASATALTARLETPDGITTDIAASDGQLDTAAGLLMLTGDVQIAASSGYAITTGALTAALDQTLLTSPGAVVATAPMGRIDAGAMRMTSQDGDYVLVFNGGVKLVYEPKK
ncbi:LPS export ABC transporter periplasmic protein LptC [Frigidibacter sp.]|uniref:LPS export ABC transporter periplasmic protein LptC n=1 Tax=Frigidibacter sp. TaxID=2586418 RepID=UPI002734607C|nr:LPS export ABC transporter periplasmic protein LptC [Frigidibacter sp.]MDP3339096.1 LPS export ABC transporter periplasmic protein LptC [Frigidibacter sp.]